MFDLLSIKQRRKFALPEKPEYYINKFEDNIYEASDKVIIQTGNSKVFLRIPKNEFKWWSPELTLSFEEKDKKSEVHELIGPNPNIFTFTVFMVFGSFAILTFASMLLYSEILMNKPVLPAIFIAMVGILVFFLSMLAYTLGKRKAKEQIITLNQVVQSIC